MNNEDIIDKEGKKIYIDYTIEIEVYVKLRLILSNYLTYYFVILLSSLEYYIRITTIILLFTYIYIYNNSYINCYLTSSKRIIKYLLNSIIVWLRIAV